MSFWNTLFGEKRSDQPIDRGCNEPNSSTETLVEMLGVPLMAGGAPMPFVLADEHNVSLFYYMQTHDPDWDGTAVRMVDVSSEGEPAAVVRFNRVLWHRLGPPNEEAIAAHPLCKIGLHPYTAKEVVGSKIIRDFCQTNRIHQYHSDSMFDGYRHFAIAFHDSVFEAIAYDYAMEELGQRSLLDAATSELSEWKK